MNVWKPLAIALGAGLVLSMVVHSTPAAAESTAACGPKQPNMSAAVSGMRGAIQSLKDAQGSLKNAEHNKGGWRVIAMNSTNASIQNIEKAIAQVNIGCNMAD